jgi:hypothetical protein
MPHAAATGKRGGICSSHMPAGARHAPGVAGGDVEVHHRLAGGGADVIAVGAILFVEEGLRLPGEEGDLFCVEGTGGRCPASVAGGLD